MLFTVHTGLDWDVFLNHIINNDSICHLWETIRVWVLGFIFTTLLTSVIWCTLPCLACAINRSGIQRFDIKLSGREIKLLSDWLSGSRRSFHLCVRNMSIWNTKWRNNIYINGYLKIMHIIYIQCSLFNSNLPNLF